MRFVGPRVRIAVAIAVGASLIGLPGPSDAQEPPASGDPIESELCVPGTPGVILGTPGNDDLQGGPGDDVICGLGGNDKLNGGDGNDVLFGGAGDDELNGSNGNDVLDAGDGNNKIQDPNGDDQIFAGSGDDQIEDSNGNDVIDAGDGNNTIKDSNGDDEIIAGAGDDEVDDSNGNDVIDAGDGDNKIKAGNGNDDVITGNGDDNIVAGDGGDVVHAGDGKNQIDTGNGDDVVTSGDGDDKIKTGNGQDHVDAGNGVDNIDVGSDDDRVAGGGGNDKIAGGDGNDWLDAGDGNDEVAGGKGTDTCIAAESQSSCELGDEQIPVLIPDIIELPDEPLLALDGFADAPGVAVLIESDGSIGRGDVSVVNATNEFAGLEDFILSPIYDIDVDNQDALVSAQLTLPYEPARLRAGEDPTQTLTLWTFDESTALWDSPVTNVVVDPDTATVTADVPHFSYWKVGPRESVPGDLFGAAEFWKDHFSQFGVRCVSPDSGAGLDVAIAIDTSGSMSWNDPSAQRVTAAQSFVAGLGENDRVAVIDFDSSARTLNSLRYLTDTNRIVVNSNINLTRNQSGGTDIGDAVAEITNQLDNSPSGRPRVGILLTDGSSSYNPQRTAEAAAENIAIFTVGLGSGVSSNLLRDIADGTGGEFISVTNANQLTSRLGEILDTLVDDGSDRDGDKITDCEEANGYLLMWPLDRGTMANPDPEPTGFSRLVTTDPDDDNDDDDGYIDGPRDGLDSFEIEGYMGEFDGDPDIAEYYQFLIDAGRTRYYIPIHGSPESDDNDDDELFEYDIIAPVNGEWGCSTDWWTNDTDRDGVDDLVECLSPDRAGPTIREPVTSALPDFSLAYHGLNSRKIDDIDYIFNHDGDLVRRNQLGGVAFGDGYECVVVTIDGYSCDDITSDQIKDLVKEQGVFQQADRGLFRSDDFARTERFRSQYVGALAWAVCVRFYEDADCNPERTTRAAKVVEDRASEGELFAVNDVGVEVPIVFGPQYANSLTSLSFEQTRTIERTRGGGGTGLRVSAAKVDAVIDDLIAFGIVGYSLDLATSPEEQAAIVGTAVRTCLNTPGISLSVTLRNLLHPCATYPIYVPSENDVGQAATHRHEAIVGDPSNGIIGDPLKASQRYESPEEAAARIVSENPGQYTLSTARVWYNSFAPCNGGVVGDGLDCDEFPNFSMAGSGPAARVQGDLTTLRYTSIELMPESPNRREGARYKRFAQQVCRPQIEQARLTFLVVPATGLLSPPRSLAVCGAVSVPQPL